MILEVLDYKKMMQKLKFFFFLFIDFVIKWSKNYKSIKFLIFKEIKISIEKGFSFV